MRLLLVFFVAFAVEAKEPWKWTLEERIAARTDPAQIRRRVEADRQRTSHRVQVAAAPAADALSGHRNPELFLPTEIVALFVESAYSVDDEPAKGFQMDAAIRAAEAGLPDDFLRVFETEAAAFIDAFRRDRALRRTMLAGTVDSIRARAELHALEETEVCPRRFDLVVRMRELYGAAFDRFLYDGIVRGMSFGYVGRTPTADELYRAMRGCR